MERRSGGNIFGVKDWILLEEIKPNSRFGSEFSPIGERDIVMVVRTDFLADIAAENPSLGLFYLFRSHRCFLFDGAITDAFGGVQSIRFGDGLRGTGIKTQPALAAIPLERFVLFEFRGGQDDTDKKI